MNNLPLVSIIIPTFNRAHLIGETLDSVLAQTYHNWECIVVDDGSTDNTDEVMAEYMDRDARFQYHNRPEDRLKGANACRNIGLEKAQGEYTVFFDSDDLMTLDHIEVKLNSILKNNTDFVVTKTSNLSGECYPKHYYAFDIVDLTPFSYISHKLNWLTLDVIIKKEVVSDIRFNENLQSGQEYNFFSKLVCKTTNYYFENHYVSLRREHSRSIRKSLDTKKKLIDSRFVSKIETYRDLNNVLQKNIRAYLLIYIVKSIYVSPNLVKGYYKFVSVELYRLIGFKSIYFGMMLLLNKVNKAYWVRNKIIEQLNQYLIRNEN